MQFVIFNDEGFCLESDDTILVLTHSKQSLFEKFTFLESHKDLYSGMPLGEKHKFPCINLSNESGTLYFDFILERIEYNNELATMWVLQDLTTHYLYLVNIQQERNENAISGEFLEMRQRAFNIERNLLRFQNEELNKIQKFKTKFYAQLSHELRTPLNSISGLSVLINEETSEEKRKDYLYALKATSKHLLSVINDVIDLSKIEEGKVSLHPQDTDLYDLINEVMASFQFKIEEKGLYIKFIHTKDFPRYAYLDPIKLRQILYNLIGNSVKFTTQGGVVIKTSVETSDVHEERLKITVLDTGIGVPSDKIERIFNPYEQGAAKVSSLYGGSGLGLSIVKQLCEVLNGTIDFKSIEGKGSIIDVYLPYVKSIEKPVEPMNTVQNARTQTVKSVIIADDDEISRKVLTVFLDKWDIKVEPVSNGKELIKKIELSSFDLIIMDYYMPEMDGLETVYYLNSMVEYTNIPIFMLTGDTSDETKKQFKTAGVTRVLNKPVIPD
ncbi:MAG: ATP-binding protein, partial [Bacteroidota bacterium]